MSKDTHPYTMAHKHCIDLIEEVSRLPIVPFGALLLLTNTARLIADQAIKNVGEARE